MKNIWRIRFQSVVALGLCLSTILLVGCNKKNITSDSKHQENDSQTSTDFLRDLIEKAYLPDCSKDFTFLVSCDQGEDYLLENLALTGEEGSISYEVSEEEDGVYRIAATKPYEQYQTYQAQGSEDMIFTEYHSKSLEFSIVGPDRINVDFNEDNLIFLKKLEIQQYGTSGLYNLQWNETSQRFYLTLYKLKGINSSMIGKIIGIGDYASVDEILQDSTRELQFAKLEKISHNTSGELLLELSPPEVSEVYDEFDIYFSGGSSKIPIEGDPEAAFMNAVVNSDGITEYLTAAYLAADSYAQDHGLMVVPLSATSSDNLKFELTEGRFDPVPGTNTCLLKLGGKVCYTVPLKNQSGHLSGSVVATCTANITSTISAGGQFEDNKSVNLHLTNTTTTTMTLGVDFSLDYSYEYETTYLVNKTTQKIHTSTCRIATNETSSSNLQKLTAQELSNMFNGDRDAMKQNDCKVCKAVTGLDGTAYAYNKNTGVLHCMNCLHVTNIKEYNLYTLYPDNTIPFEECKDCHPSSRQTEDFDNRMLNAIKGSDWSEQLENLRNALGDSIGKRKPSPATDPGLSVPINIGGVFNIRIGVRPVLEFDMKASIKFTITGTTTNTYGIRNVGKGFETFHNEKPGEVVYDLTFTGEADVNFGIEMFVSAYPVGLDHAAYISMSGQVGAYGHLSGIFKSTGTVGVANDTFSAARLEMGLYVRMDGYWKILWFDDSFEIIQEKQIPLRKWGYDRVYYAFENEEIEVTVDDPNKLVLIDLSDLMNVKYLDLTKMAYNTGKIQPTGKVSLLGETYFNVAVKIINEDGSPCDYLMYDDYLGTGKIIRKPNTPEEFVAVVEVQVTPQVQIGSLDAFLASDTKKSIYGSVMDPLVIHLKVEEPHLTKNNMEEFRQYYMEDETICHAELHYNSNGLVERVSYSGCDHTWHMDSTYFYDTKNRLVHYERGSTDDDYYDDYKRIDLTYDPNGRLDTWKIFNPSWGDPHGKCEYNKKGQLIASVGDYFNISYTYDAQGYLSEVHVLPVGEDLTPYHEEILVYEYDDQSRVSRIISQSSSYGGFSSPVEYLYDYEHYPFIVESTLSDGKLSYCYVFYDFGLVDLPMGILGATNDIIPYISPIYGYSDFLPTMTYEGDMLEFIATSEGLYDFAYNSDHTTSPTSTKSDNVADVSAYIEVVEQAIEENKSGLSNCGYGALYDIDGNGVDELMLCYQKQLNHYWCEEVDCREESCNAMGAVCSAYTMSGDKVIPLLEEECLWVDGEVNSPVGSIGVVKQDGNTYLATVSGDVYGYDNYMESRGKRTLYELCNGSLTLDAAIGYLEMRYDSVVQNGSYVTINGEKFEYSVYEKWEKEIEELVTVYVFPHEIYPHVGQTMSLEDLLAYLQGLYDSDHTTPETSTKSDNINDLSAYADVVKRAIKENSKYDWVPAYGALYDIDKNGVEELLLCYYMDVDPGSEFWSVSVVCDVYTISGGQAVPLLDQEVLYLDAGGPWGYVGVVKKDGETYLATTSSNGSVWGDQEHYFGNWYLYEVNNTSLKQKIELEHERLTEDNTIISSSSFVLINGQKFDYPTYEKWENEIEEVLVVYPFDDGWSPQYGETMTLQELLEHIEENKTK